MALSYAQPVSRRLLWRALCYLGLALALLLYGMAFALLPAAGIALWLAAVIAWYAARRLEWAALGLFLLVPLGRLTWLNDTGTLDATKFLIAALAAAWFGRCLLTRDRRLLSVWTESAISVLLLLFLLSNLISLLNVWDLRRSLLSLLRLASLLVMYTLMVALVRTKREVKIAILFLLLTGLAVCLLGLWEFTSHQYLWHLLGQDRSLPPGLASASGVAGATGPFALRIITVFIDYNFMGGYMAVLFGIVGGCWLAFRQWYLRLALAGLAALIACNAALTGSRGGIVGLSVAALALLVMSRLRVRWFVLATVLVAAIAIFPVADQLAPQFRGGISLEDLKQDQRWGYWQMAFQMMRDHPIIGVGTDNFFSLYSWYRVSPALMSPYYCHNIYLQMWAEAGLIGLLSILSLVIVVGLTYARTVRQATDEVWHFLVVGLFSAFLGYAVFAASCNTLHDQPFWMLMALAVIVARATRAEERPRGPAVPPGQTAGTAPQPAPLAA